MDESADALHAYRRCYAQQLQPLFEQLLQAATMIRDATGDGEQRLLQLLAEDILEQVERAQCLVDAAFARYLDGSPPGAEREAEVAEYAETCACIAGVLARLAPLQAG